MILWCHLSKLDNLSEASERGATDSRDDSALVFFSLILQLSVHPALSGLRQHNELADSEVFLWTKLLDDWTGMQGSTLEGKYNNFREMWKGLIHVTSFCDLSVAVVMRYSLRLDSCQLLFVICWNSLVSLIYVLLQGFIQFKCGGQDWKLDCHTIVVVVCSGLLLFFFFLLGLSGECPEYTAAIWLIVLPLDIPDLTASLLLWGPSGQRWRCLWTFLFFKCSNFCH